MVLCFVQNTRVIIFIFYVAQKSRIFFPEFNIRLYDKNSDSNQIIFFPSSTKIRIFFSATLGIRIFFQKKKHNPSFKLNGRSLNCFIFSDYDSLRDVRKKNNRMVNIDKKIYEINSLHVYSCYDFICKELFVVRLQKNQYKSTVYTHNSYNM